MKKVLIKDLNLRQFDSLINESAIKHFVTDRKSNQQGREFTFSYLTVPHRNEVFQIRISLA